MFMQIFNIPKSGVLYVPKKITLKVCDLYVCKFKDDFKNKMIIINEQIIDINKIGFLITDIIDFLEHNFFKSINLRRISNNMTIFITKNKEYSQKDVMIMLKNT